MTSHKKTPRSETKVVPLGRGEYLPDPTQAIERVKDLPQPVVVVEDRNRSQLECPQCHQPAPRNQVKQRHLHDLGDLVRECPREIEVVYSVHRCSHCRLYFAVDTSDLAPPRSQYTRRVVALAIRAVTEDGQPYRDVSWRMWRDHRVFVPFATIQNWVEAGGKKGAGALRN